MPSHCSMCDLCILMVNVFFCFRNVNVSALKHEAEFYGIHPLGNRYCCSTHAHIYTQKRKNAFIVAHFNACMSCLSYTVKRLAVCEELEKSSCGSILFYAQLNPPGGII